MAKLHKVTWFYSGVNHGWTESLYFNSTDEKHETTMVEAKFIAQLRGDLLGDECQATAIRVSTEGVNQDAMLRYLDPREQLQGEPSAENDVGVLVRCEDADHTRWKHIFLRGVWDSIEENGGKYKKNKPKWKKLMGPYLNALTKSQWCWLRQIRDTKFKITNVVMGAGDRTTFTAANTPWVGFDVGRKMTVRVTGVNGKSAANGLHVVEVVDQSNVKTVFPLAVGEYRAGGTISKYNPEAIGIKFAVDEKITTRRVGAPLLESHGHRKARPRA